MTTIDRAIEHLQGKLQRAKTPEDKKGAMNEMRQAEIALQWAKRREKERAA